MRWGWPLALVCALGAPSLHQSLAQDDSGSARLTVGHVLAQWERASSGLLGVGPMEHRRMHYLHGADHSAHELAVLNEFRGPVSAQDLSQRFEWSLKESDGDFVIVGRPTDEVEKLFYRELTVAIDPETHLPRTVGFSGTNAEESREPLAVVMSPRIEEPHRFPHDPDARPIQVASNEPPSARRSPIRVVEHITTGAKGKPELPADAEHALKVLETALGEVRSFHAHVNRYTYEIQNHIEHRAVGEFSFVAPFTMQCALRPASLDPKATSHKRTPDGAAFELLPSPAEYWQYTPAEIRFSHHPNQPAWVLSHKSGDANQVRIVSREEHQAAGHEGTIIPPWPMLFHPNALELAERFDIRMDEQQHMIAWDFTPRHAGDWGRFRLMRVLIDKASSLPKAVKFINKAGDVEMVYTFEYTQLQRQKPQGIEPEVLPIRPEVPKLEPAPTDLHGQP